MPRHLVLTVPAPWGLALVLGLLDRWHHYQPAPSGLVLPAPLEIVQERLGNDYTGALEQVDKLARKRGRGPLIHLVPWAYTPSGPVGTATLTSCDRTWRERHGMATGWRWNLSNPRPAWADASAACA